MATTFEHIQRAAAFIDHSLQALENARQENGHAPLPDVAEEGARLLEAAKTALWSVRP